MIVPFSVADFIDRAVQVYGERVGVVDEPDQPAPSLGEVTYAELGALARRQAAYLDSLGIGVGEALAPSSAIWIVCRGAGSSAADATRFPATNAPSGSIRARAAKAFQDVRMTRASSPDVAPT